MTAKHETEHGMTDTVFEARGLLRASSAPGLEAFLRRQPGVADAEANPISQSVTVHYDQATLTADGVRALIETFGCSCGGEVVPCYLCLDEQPAVVGSTVPHGAAHAVAADDHASHAMSMPPPALAAEAKLRPLIRCAAQSAEMSRQSMPQTFSV